MGRLLGLWVALGLSGCASVVENADVDETDETDESDPPEPSTETDAPDGPSAPTRALISTLAFVREQSPGITRGFDLDDQGFEGCRVVDQLSPEGTPGIDNAFARFMPVLEGVGASSLYALVQEAVTEGDLLLVVSFGDLATFASDDCVPAQFALVRGEPELGARGGILPFQTFDLDPDLPPQEVSCASVEADGALVLDGVSFRIPIQLLNRPLDLTLRRVRLRLTPDGDGWRGTLGGGIPAAELEGNFRQFDRLPAQTQAEVLGALDALIDLRSEPEGPCDLVSATLDFEAVPAFLFGDEP